MTAETIRIESRELWWLPLFTGVCWIVFALLLFRFDYTSVQTLSILTGVFCLAAAGAELLGLPGSHGWWRVGRVALAIGFVVVGVVAFAKPGDTVEALGGIFAFYLLLRGVFDVGVALLVRGELWLLGLAAGLAQILLAFWAAGDFGHKAILLVVWIGGSALIHGIVQIVTAFALKGAEA